MYIFVYVYTHHLLFVLCYAKLYGMLARSALTIGVMRLYVQYVQYVQYATSSLMHICSALMDMGMGPGPQSLGAIRIYQARWALRSFLELVFLFAEHTRIIGH